MKIVNSLHLPKTFFELPCTYRELCDIHLPRPIHDSYDYQETVAIAGLFAGFEEKMTEDQRDYFDLLSNVIADYDSIESSQPSAKKRLSHLLEESGTSASRLASILGLERSVGIRIVNGERNLTVEHVKKLSRHFKLEPSFFI